MGAALKGGGGNAGDLAAARAEVGWPAEADLIISALEAGRGGDWADRRVGKRFPHRVRAEVRLFSDGPAEAARVIYTRDLDARGVGFISRERLPLGYGGMVAFIAPGGEGVMLGCTLLRCREAAPGWYEGALYFNREQVWEGGGMTKPE